MDNASFTLRTCKTCIEKDCLKHGKGYGKPCKDVEKRLRDEGIRGRDWSGPQFGANIKKGKKEKSQKRETPISSLSPDDWDKVRKQGISAEDFGI